MSLLLLIDTSGETGSVALSENEQVLSYRSCNDQQEQARFLQLAIKEMMDETGKSFSDLSAVAVTIGPGSYTGLRVGLASAKGLCYACNIPLITLTTTYVMSVAAKKAFEKLQPGCSSFYLFPMIDARRMEVFLALYNENLEEIHPPSAYILDDPAMIVFKEDNPVFCFGNGSAKWKEMNRSVNTYFGEVNWDARTMAEEVFRKFSDRSFDSLEKTAPLYAKPFYTNVVKK